jgi:hypothetical protein
MKLHIGMRLEPMLVLLVRVEIVQNDVKLAFRKGCGNAVHEAKKFDTATELKPKVGDGMTG